MKKINVHLGLNKEYTVSLELFDNRVANCIWEMIHDASEIDFVSRTQFYEFGETTEQVEAKLAQAIEHLKRLKPEDFLEHDELNRLHTNFPDILPNEDDLETRHWLSMFNYHLHHLERKNSIHKSKRQFLFSTVITPIPLRHEDYDLFTVTKKENTVYMNYPHVGKHIMEIVGDNDIDVPANHIVPTHHIKADLLFHLDKTQWEEDEPAVKNYINRWLSNNIEDKLPYPINDKRLAIGHIPVGRILNPSIEAITANQYIHSIEAV